MFHHSWQHDGAVDGWPDDASLLGALDEGARVVAFELVLSFGTGYYKATRLHLVPAGASAFGASASTQLLTLLVGWWGLGLLFMPTALWRNLRGGTDVTDAVRAHRVARLAGRQAQARVEVEAAAAAATGTLEERRAEAERLLERREVEGAWSLVGKEVLDGPLRRDFPLVRKLLIAASDTRGQEARAGLLATILVQEHPGEVKDHLAYIVRKSLRAAGAPPGVGPKAPLLSTGRGLLLLVAAAALSLGLIGVALNEWLRTHRELHVVNGTQDPVVVRVGGERLAVPAGDRAAVTVSEGPVAWEVERRGATRAGTVDLRLAWHERFSPATCVLNVEGAAALVREQIAWVAAGRAPPETDAPRTHFGEWLTVVPGAKPFADFPRTKSLQRGQSEVDTRVVLREGHPADLVYDLPGLTVVQAIDYLELHARLAPADARLLDVYLQLALVGDPERATKFLAAGLTGESSGPWLLAWAQTHAHGGGDADALLATLRALPGPPTAARLAYEARLAPDAAAAAPLLRRAAEADPAEPLLALAEAEAALRRGDAPAAGAALLRAGPGRAQRNAEQLLARVASEPVARATLVGLERQLHRDRFLVDVEPLLELRAALGGEKSVDAAISPLLLDVGEGDDSTGWRLRVRFARAAALGDATELRALGAESNAPYPTLMAALLEGDPRAAAEAGAAVGADPSLADDLSLALALALVKGDAAAASRLRPVVVSAWGAVGARGGPALEALDGEPEVARAALDRLTLWPTACDALRLAVAASAPPSARAPLLAPVLPPRGPGYPCAVVRALRASLAAAPEARAGE